MQNVKRARWWALAAVLFFVGTAEAQTKPFRADGGIQAATQSGWTGSNGVPGLYYKVSSGWWVRKPDNTEIGPLGTGGGGSTLALAYAAGASGTDSTLSLDSTRLQLKILAPASALGTLFSVRNNADTNSFFQLTDNSTQQIKSSIADGASSVGVLVDSTNAFANQTAKMLRISSGGTERAAFTPYGQTLTPLAASSGTPLAFSLTGAAHTGLTASTEVSDVDLNLARTVTWSTGALALERVVRLRPPTLAFAAASTVTSTASLWCDGAPKAGANATLTRSACVWLQTGADSARGLVLQANSSTQSAPIWESLDSSGNALASLTMTDSGQSNKFVMSSQLNGGYDFLRATTPAGALNMQLNAGTFIMYGGGSYTYMDTLGSVVYFNVTSAGAMAQRFSQSTSTSMAFSATPAFDCTVSNMIDMGPVTGNITGPTMVSGRAGETCHIVLRKDGTASTYTITGSWGSNVRQGTGAPFTSGAGSIVSYTFTWDDRLSTPAWVLMSSAAFN